MTEDEIRKMEAGREINALVAEQIMQWIPTEVGEDDNIAWLEVMEDFEELQWTGYLDEVIPGFYGEINWRLDDGSVCTASGIRGVAWEPSVKIKHAWQVVEKMLSDGYSISVANHTSKGGQPYWGIDFYMDHLCWSADSVTVELAICRAALLAVMSDGR